MPTNPSLIEPAQNYTFDASVDSWVALRTAARWEKSVAESLTQVKVRVFLPFMNRVTKYLNKKRSVVVPVFPGYLFCEEIGFLGNPSVPRSCRSKVAQVLRPSDPKQLFGELSAMSGLLKDRQLFQERVVGKPGDVVRITGGPFLGSEGTILRLKPNKWQVVIEVSFIGAKVVAEVDSRMIERL